MRVYEALTMTEQFDQIIKLTRVMHSPAMAAMRKPTQISRHAGGTFTLSGGTSSAVISNSSPES